MSVEFLYDDDISDSNLTATPIAVMRKIANYSREYITIVSMCQLCLVCTKSAANHILEHCKVIGATN